MLNELNVLTLSFPHLRDAVDRDDLPVKFILRQGPRQREPTEAPAKRRKMSAKARKAIRQGERKRWAVAEKAADKKKY